MTTKRKLIIVIKYLLAILFVYAGTYKLGNLSVFRSQLEESPLLPSALIPVIAIVVPVYEMVLAFLLVFYKKLEYNLLWLSFSLMLFFSIYLIMLFTLYDRPPCACGGILTGMEYPAHIVFNIVFTLASFTSILLSNEK